MAVFDRIFVIVSCNSKPESRGDISHYKMSLILDYAVRLRSRGKSDSSGKKNEFDRLGEPEIGTLESIINSNEKKK